MHKKLLNAARLEFEVVPQGPILIKSGLESPDPTRPDMEFVRTRHPLLGETVYLPGTSLKGGIRSQAERILRGLGLPACDPFDNSSDCRRTVRGETAQTFARQCFACRTFGSLSVAGRCAVLDAYPWPPGADEAEMRERAAVANRTERRNQVAISRATGATHGGALYDMEVVVAGRFHAALVLRNFQLWQLGLVAAVLQDYTEGFQRLGFGKSRGLGFVDVQARSLTIETCRHEQRRLQGCGELVDAAERAAYGLVPGDAVALPEGLAAQRTWRGARVEATGRDVGRLLKAIVDGPLSALPGAASAARGR